MVQFQSNVIQKIQTKQAGEMVVVMPHVSQSILQWNSQNVIVNITDKFIIIKTIHRLGLIQECHFVNQEKFSLFLDQMQRVSILGDVK